LQFFFLFVEFGGYLFGVIDGVFHDIEFLVLLFGLSFFAEVEQILSSLSDVLAQHITV